MRIRSCLNPLGNSKVHARLRAIVVEKALNPYQLQPCGSKAGCMGNAYRILSNPNFKCLQSQLEK